MKVTVNHNGTTIHNGFVYAYEAGVPVELPQEVLQALGEANYKIDDGKETVTKQEQVQATEPEQQVEVKQESAQPEVEESKPVEEPAK